MIKSLLTPILTALTMTSMAVTTIQTRPAQGSFTQFFCDTTNYPHPTTVVRTPKRTTDIIHWRYNHQNYTARERCEQVSRRFQDAYNEGLLGYLTTGEMDGQPIICVAEYKGGNCVGMLFTLLHQDNREEKLDKLLELRDYASVALQMGLELTTEVDGRLYINIETWFDLIRIEQQRESQNLISKTC